MSLIEQSYSLLIVSASEKSKQTLLGVFTKPVFSPVNTVSNINAAKRAMIEQSFDVVVINSPLPDGTGIHFAVDTAESGNSVTLLLAKEDIFCDSRDMLEKNGVFVLRKPTPGSIFQIAVGWLISARERIRKTEKKAQTIEDKMNEIRLVNRAKWLLISELQMSEPEAHRYVEKQAMNRCVSKREIAEEIIKTYS